MYNIKDNIKDNMVKTYNIAVEKRDSIIDGYECYEYCRVCPFPGAKCYKRKNLQKKDIT